MALITPKLWSFSIVTRNEKSVCFVYHANRQYMVKAYAISVIAIGGFCYLVNYICILHYVDVCKCFLVCFSINSISC